MSLDGGAQPDLPQSVIAGMTAGVMKPPPQHAGARPQDLEAFLRGVGENVGENVGNHFRQSGISARNWWTYTVNLLAGVGGLVLAWKMFGSWPRRSR